MDAFQRNVLIERKTIFQILKLNLIPCPRVISPGPRTEFPVLFHGEVDPPVVVKDLDAAKKLSSQKSQEQPSPFFFTEYYSFEPGFNVDIWGLKDVPSLTSLATRASYCLGYENARVLLGTSPKGLLVLDVKEKESETFLADGHPDAPFEKPEFRAMFCEYVTSDLRSGEVLPKPLHFRRVEISSEKGISAARDLRDCAPVFSSPMPFPEVPLSTLIHFSGRPGPGFLRLLDSTLGVMGMLICPIGETRRRNATGEGFLGNFRLLSDFEGFSYQTMPSILGAVWDIERKAKKNAQEHMESLLGAIVALTKAITHSPTTFSQFDWKGPLDQVYRWQKAFYHGDKGFFRNWTKEMHRTLETVGLDRKDLLAIKKLLGMALIGRDVENGRPYPKSSWPSYLIVNDDDWKTAIPEHLPLRVSAGPLGVLLDSKRIINAMGIPICNPLPQHMLEEKTRQKAFYQHLKVRLNPGLSSELFLPWELEYRAEVSLSSKETSIRLGPILGIVAGSDDAGRRFGIEEDRFRRLIDIGKDMGILVYVISPNQLPQLSSSVSTIDGWLYRDDQGWFSEKLPLPDVIYDRYIRPEEELHFPRLINSTGFVNACKDKLKGFEILSQDHILIEHLPETQLAEDPKDVLDFVHRWKKVFLKLLFGHGSKGLSFIEESTLKGHESGHTPLFFVERFPEDTAFQEGFSSTLPCVKEELLHFLDGILSREGWEERANEGNERRGAAFRKPIYIMQKAVETRGTRVFEIRVICQKGNEGRWLRTGMVARVSEGSRKFMVPKEEVHQRVDEILQRLYPKQHQEIKEAIRRLATRIPRIIEQSAGPGGEMSCDFIVDKDGKPWLIEINSKPATLFRDIGAFNLRKLSLVRILNYAVHLFSQQ